MKIYIYDEIIANWQNKQKLPDLFSLKDVVKLVPNKDIMSVKYQLRQLRAYGLIRLDKKKFKKAKVLPSGEEIYETDARRYRKLFDSIADWVDDYVSKIKIKSSPKLPNAGDDEFLKDVGNSK